MTFQETELKKRISQYSIINYSQQAWSIFCGNWNVYGAGLEIKKRYNLIPVVAWIFFVDRTTKYTMWQIFRNHSAQ